ncbi:MAG: WecB/TagA/CpsF family glycosyltransferase [Deltaproteobacteria bacterium]|nr:WecB/TagA/CpsF family glycosyltransferase [Deltaproteobacteria bacterium]
MELFGYRISAAGLESDVAEALSWVKNHDAVRYMATANPHSLVVASKDVAFRTALQQADILIPDGTGILMATRVLDTSPPVREKVAGTDFFLRFTELAERVGGLKYFFLGSSENVLSLIRSRIARDYPGIEVCGTYSPPFRERFSDEENQQMLDVIRAARPDVLWVGLTAPKQEKWIFENRSKLDVPFMGAIGAVFDFYAGTKVRSSLYWQKLGLEWLPRFFREPGRLWERNVKSTPIFLIWVVREKIRRVFSAGKREE